MNNRLTIQDIASLMAERTGKDKSLVELFLKEFIAQIREGVYSDKIAKVKGVGTFKIIAVDPRESIHVNTGERFLIPAHYKFSFLPDKELRDLVNKPFSFFETTELNENVGFSDLDESEEAENKEADAEDESVEEVMPDEQPVEALPGVAPRLSAENASAIMETETTHPDENQLVQPEEIPTGPLPLAIPIEEKPAETSPEEELDAAADETPADEIIVSETTASETATCQTTADEPVAVADAIADHEITTDEPTAGETETSAKETNPLPETVAATSGFPENAPGNAAAEVPGSTNEKSDPNLPLPGQGDILHPGYPDCEPTDFPAANETENKKNGVTFRQNVILAFTVLMCCIGIAYLYANRHFIRAVLFGVEVVYPDPPTSAAEPLSLPEVPASPVAAAADTTQSAMPADTTTVRSAAEASAPAPQPARPASPKILATVKIEPGSRLTLISLKYYGSKIFWVYLYEYNKTRIKDPNNIPVGTPIEVPAPETYGIDVRNKASVRKASALQTEILAREK